MKKPWIAPVLVEFQIHGGTATYAAETFGNQS
jgi:hypothetical protein